jgi:hypothetical protein
MVGETLNKFQHSRVRTRLECLQGNFYLTLIKRQKVYLFWGHLLSKAKELKTQCAKDNFQRCMYNLLKSPFFKRLNEILKLAYTRVKI